MKKILVLLVLTFLIGCDGASDKESQTNDNASIELKKLEESSTKWVEGFAQGNFEYSINFNDHNVRLTINCPTEEGNSESHSDVALYNIDTSNPISKFSINVNGVTCEGPFVANTRNGTNDFLSLLEALRENNAILNFNGVKVIIPKSNANKVLPIYGKKFDCNLD